MTALLAVLAVVLGGLAVAPSAASALTSARRRRGRAEARAGFPALVDALAAALRGGLSLPLAFAEIAATTPPALARDCFAVAADLWLGASCADALMSFERTVPADDVAPLAIVLSSFQRSGGRIASALERVSALLRGRIALADERRALSAQSRTSSVVLISLAPMGVLFFSLAMPDYLVTFVSDGLGLGVLALVFELFGTYWLWRIVRTTRSVDDLASFLDAVVVGLDAGLTFERALAGIVERVPKLARADDARRLLADLRLGQGLLRSLRRFARDPEELQVAALVTASATFGAPLAQLLVVHANAVRERQRHDAETAARRLPVLMLFPLACCILPALLIVFLGPPLLSLMR